MSGQMDHVDSSVGSTGGANGQLEDAAGLPGTDQPFVMLRTTMRDKIQEHIRRKPSLAERQHQVPVLTKYLEKILYTKFANKNDYYNMMKGPIQPQLLFAMKTLIAQNPQYQRNPQVERQTPPSSSSNLSTPYLRGMGMRSRQTMRGQPSKGFRCCNCRWS